MTFWDAGIVAGVVILAVGIVELWERLIQRRRDTQTANTFEQARQDRIDAANLAAFFPPKNGPGGFAAQGDRRAHTAHVQQIRSRKVN